MKRHSARTAHPSQDAQVFHANGHPLHLIPSQEVFAACEQIKECPPELSCLVSSFVTTVQHLQTESMLTEQPDTPEPDTSSLQIPEDTPITQDVLQQLYVAFLKIYHGQPQTHHMDGTYHTLKWHMSANQQWLQILNALIARNQDDAPTINPFLKKGLEHQMHLIVSHMLLLLNEEALILKPQVEHYQPLIDAAHLDHFNALYWKIRERPTAQEPSGPLDFLPYYLRDALHALHWSSWRPDHLNLIQVMDQYLALVVQEECDKTTPRTHQDWPFLHALTHVAFRHALVDHPTSDRATFLMESSLALLSQCPVPPEKERGPLYQAHQEEERSLMSLKALLMKTIQNPIDTEHTTDRTVLIFYHYLNLQNTFHGVQEHHKNPAYCLFERVKAQEQFKGSLSHLLSMHLYFSRQDHTNPLSFYNGYLHNFDEYLEHSKENPDDTQIFDRITQLLMDPKISCMAAQGTLTHIKEHKDHPAYGALQLLLCEISMVRTLEAALTTSSWDPHATPHTQPTYLQLFFKLLSEHAEIRFSLLKKQHNKTPHLDNLEPALWREHEVITACINAGSFMLDFGTTRSTHRHHQAVDSPIEALHHKAALIRELIPCLLKAGYQKEAHAAYFFLIGLSKNPHPSTTILQIIQDLRKELKNITHWKELEHTSIRAIAPNSAHSMFLDMMLHLQKTIPKELRLTPFEQLHVNVTTWAQTLSQKIQKTVMQHMQETPSRNDEAMNSPNETRPNIDTKELIKQECERHPGGQQAVDFFNKCPLHFIEDLKQPQITQEARDLVAQQKERLRQKIERMKQMYLETRAWKDPDDPQHTALPWILDASDEGWLCAPQNPSKATKKKGQKKKTKKEVKKKTKKEAATDWSVLDSCQTPDQAASLLQKKPYNTDHRTIKLSFFDVPHEKKHATWVMHTFRLNDCIAHVREVLEGAMRHNTPVWIACQDDEVFSVVQQHVKEELKQNAPLVKEICNLFLALSYRCIPPFTKEDMNTILPHVAAFYDLWHHIYHSNHLTPYHPEEYQQVCDQLFMSLQEHLYPFVQQQRQHDLADQEAKASVQEQPPQTCDALVRKEPNETQPKPPVIQATREAPQPAPQPTRPTFVSDAKLTASEKRKAQRERRKQREAQTQAEQQALLEQQQRLEAEQAKHQQAEQAKIKATKTAQQKPAAQLPQPSRSMARVPAATTRPSVLPPPVLVRTPPQAPPQKTNEDFPALPQVQTAEQATKKAKPEQPPVLVRMPPTEPLHTTHEDFPALPVKTPAATDRPASPQAPAALPQVQAAEQPAFRQAKQQPEQPPVLVRTLPQVPPTTTKEAPSALPPPPTKAPTQSTPLSAEAQEFTWPVQQAPVASVVAPQPPLPDPSYYEGPTYGAPTCYMPPPMVMGPPQPALFTPVAQLPGGQTFGYVAPIMVPSVPVPFFQEPPHRGQPQ